MAQGDARALLDGCDETADCPAKAHTSICWRGYWLTHQPSERESG